MFMLIDNYHNEEQTNDRAAIHNLLHINNHNLRSVCVVHNIKDKIVFCSQQFLELQTHLINRMDCLIKY